MAATKVYLAIALTLLVLVTPSYASARSLTTTSPTLKIAPGLHAADLCYAVKHHTERLIKAIVACTQKECSAYIGEAVDASVTSPNNCPDEFFEVVNQAIDKGGETTETIVAYALVAASAKGTADAGAQVVATATANVICKGGASASACARAWARAVTIDAKGCAVLRLAYARAKASCGPDGAKSKSYAFTFVKPLGTCKEPDFTGGNNNDGGDVTANAASNAWGSGGGDVAANSNANAWGNGGGDVTANSASNAWGTGGGDVAATATSNAWGKDGDTVTANSVANAHGK